jgi:hypothetical protein
MRGSHGHGPNPSNRTVDHRPLSRKERLLVDWFEEYGGIPNGVRDAFVWGFAEDTEPQNEHEKRLWLAFPEGIPTRHAVTMSDNSSSQPPSETERDAHRRVLAEWLDKPWKPLEDLDTRFLYDGMYVPESPSAAEERFLEERREARHEEE